MSHSRFGFAVAPLLIFCSVLAPAAFGQSSSLQFYPISPCRLADTRGASAGFYGVAPFSGPYIQAGQTVTFPVLSSAQTQTTAPSPCGAIPSNAQAYSLNLTVIPHAGIGSPVNYVTMWPAGATQPVVATLDDPQGAIISNAAFVGAGASGSINVYATNNADIILDMDGYYAQSPTEGSAAGLQFYPVTPCRLVDTRGSSAGFNGVSPFNGPYLQAGQTATFPLLSPSQAQTTAPSPCGAIPANVQAFSLNLTVVPHSGNNPVNYVTMWPAGVNQPSVATLDDPQGAIVSDAAIVGAGASGSISVYANGGAADIILDMDGYYAPPAADPNPLQFFTTAPCRLVDTRGSAGGFSGVSPFSGPYLQAGQTVIFPVLSSLQTQTTAPSPCGAIPSTAQAYSLNLTVVPHFGTNAVNYVTMWPTGQAQPVVATLNDPQGIIVSNAALVAAGTSGSINVYANGGAADIIIDMNGYYAPPTAGPMAMTTSSPLPNGTAGSFYSQSFSASGGTPPYAWFATGLPIGFTMSLGGVYSGTPVVADTLAPVVTVLDSAGHQVSRAFSFTANANGSTIASPSALQPNLSFMTFGYYDTSHIASSNGFSQSCPSGSSVRGCFQQVLANLRAQGASGVRIWVGLCEWDLSVSPLTNCGQPTSSVYFNGTTNGSPGFTWLANASNFFLDVANAGIKNVTITLADTPAEYCIPGSNPCALLTGPLSGATSPSGSQCTRGASDPVQYSPTIPFGLNSNNYYPIGQDEPGSNGYNCAPINPYFVGWNNELSAINALLGVAQGKVNVYELELENEINMVDFTAELRRVYDNSSGSIVNVYGQFAALMSSHGYDPKRVTYSAPYSDSSNPTGNCTNIYTDYSRQFNLDSVFSAIAGGYVGVNQDASSVQVPDLWCGGSNLASMRLSPMSQPLPDIVDSHNYPSSLAGATDTHVQQVAALDYSDLVHFFQLLNLSFQSTTLVLGETDSATWAPSCNGSPSFPNYAFPSENVAGFNQSQLAGSPIVFRPWLEIEDPTGTCFPYPTYENMNSMGTGPYTPTQQ